MTQIYLVGRWGYRGSPRIFHPKKLYFHHSFPPIDMAENKNAVPLTPTIEGE
jgi:predicted RNA-binding protein